MNVTTVPEPEVVITMSWQEAEILRDMCGGTNPGKSGGELDFIHTLNNKLLLVGIKRSVSRRTFEGKFDG